MFLDEELNKIYNEKGFSKESSFKLAEACIKRLDFTNGWAALYNSLKRTDSSWRMFCKEHKEYNEDGFRRMYLNTLGEDEMGLKLKEKVRQALNW